MPFEIIRNDITKVAADAVVNTANPRPVVGGGTDTAVYRAAGKTRLLAQRRKIGDIAPGQAAATDAFRLPAKHIIHTVGPVWQGGNSGERDVLRACYANSLALADSLGCESVAFPLIATGSYGFPKDEALQIALGEIGKFLLTHEMRVILVVFDARSFALSAGLMGEIEQYIDDRAAGLLREQEYGDASQDVHAEGRFRGRRSRRETDESAVLPEEACRTEAPEADLPPDACFSSGSDGAPARTEASEPFFPAPAAQSESAKPFRAAARKKEAGAYGAFAAFDARPAPQPVPFSEFSSSGKSLDELLDSAGKTFQQKLFELIDASGMDDVTVYKKANVDRKVFSRIRCKEDYRPTKKTAVAFAIALELDMPTMLDLLARAEIAFSPSSKFDLIVTYFVTHKIYDIFEINAALFQYGQPLLGA